MSIFSREAARKRVKHAEMRMEWGVNCNFRRKNVPVYQNFSESAVKLC